MSRVKPMTRAPATGVPALSEVTQRSRFCWAAFIGQAQIGDFKDPGRGGRRAAGLVVPHPDEFQGAGLLALSEAQRQSDRPGLVLFTRGGKELLFG